MVAGVLDGLGGLIVVPQIEWAIPFVRDAQAIVLVAERHTGAAASVSRDVQDALPGTPLFVVLPLSSANIHASDALHAIATGVVWEDRLDDLRLLLASGVEGDPLAWLHAQIRSIAPGSDLVGQIADHLCRRPEPPRTVKRMASLLGISEPTLRRHWWADTESAVSLRVLLDWALVCGWARVAGQMTISAAAASLRVDTRTLERAVRRLGLGTPRQAGTDRDALFARAREDLRRGPRSALGSA